MTQFKLSQFQAAKRNHPLFLTQVLQKSIQLLTSGSWLSLVLIGCTQPNLDSTSSAVQSASTSSPASSQAQTIRIGYIKTGLSAIAKQRGVLEKELAARQINVEWAGPFPSFAPTLEAVNANSADIAVGGDIPGLSALSGGIPACIVAYQPPDPEGEAIVVPANSSIRTPADLIGKKVIVNRGGWGEHLLLKVLEANNIPKDQVELAYLKPDEAFSAFGSEKADAWAVWDPWVAMAEVKLGARRIISAKDVPHYSIFLVRRDTLAQKPDVIKETLLAHQQEGEWFEANSSEAKEVTETLLQVPREVVEKSFTRRPTEQVIFPLEPQVIKDLQASADWLLQQGVISKPVDVAASTCPSDALR